MSTIAQAIAETIPCMACKGKGWIVADVDSTGKLEIQRCDSCMLFTNDGAAVLHVANSFEAMRGALQQLINIATHPSATKNEIRMIAREARIALALANGEEQ